MLNHRRGCGFFSIEIRGLGDGAGDREAVPTMVVFFVYFWVVFCAFCCRLLGLFRAKRRSVFDRKKRAVFEAKSERFSNKKSGLFLLLFWPKKRTQNRDPYQLFMVPWIVDKHLGFRRLFLVKKVAQKDHFFC